ncbi:MAG: CBS domain-containing protein [Planctomycetaceae bacterium]|nr:CBS domain-containing protein [Planctomycetaceae bacterium]
MKLQDILGVKGGTVYSISGGATLQEVVARLVEHRVGAMLVLALDAAGREEVAGIVTERDILYASTAGKPPLGEVTAAEVMSRPVVTGSPDDEVDDVMGLMTSRRIRHLPVLGANGQLAGIISIGDVVKAQHDRLALENRCLKDYIAG